MDGYTGEPKSQWSFGDDYLDTDVIRGISYGNLFLRKYSHIYLFKGVVGALVFFGLFWLATTNWETLTAWSGFFEKDDDKDRVYTAVTTITQLPPPPPIEKPPPPKPIPKAAPPKPKAPPPNVGKIKKVKKEEAPPEQTLATQKEIKKAVQQGAGTGIADGPVFFPVDKMPRFKRQRKPRYPESARRAGIEGRVSVAVLISEEGRPIKARIMSREPSDERVFDKAAVNAVMKSTFYPGIQSGRAVKVWLTIPIRFMLR